MKLKVSECAKADGSMAWCVKSDDADEPLLMCDSEEEANAYVEEIEDAGTNTDASVEVLQARLAKAGARVKTQAVKVGEAKAKYLAIVSRNAHAHSAIAAKSGSAGDHEKARESHAHAAEIHAKIGGSEAGIHTAHAEKHAAESKSAGGGGDQPRDKNGMWTKDSGRQRVSRVDVAGGELRKPVKMANGWLRVDGHLTQTGVFLYRNSDGTPRRELRLPEDVFHQDSLETFAMVPVTDEHPPQFLNSSNTGEYQRGHIGESVVRDGKMMRASMLITDKALVEKIEKGRAVQISNGYTCDLEEKAGVTDDGEKYDCIQRNIVANHVAIVPVGRAGPGARVRMDSGADVLLSISSVGAVPAPIPASEKTTVKKIRIDGVEYEAGSEEAVKAQSAFQLKLEGLEKSRSDAELKRIDADKKRDEQIAEMNKKFDSLQATADKNAERADKAEKDLKAAPAKVEAALKARMALEANAEKILGSKAAKKFDSLTDKDLKLAVLNETDPELKLDGKSDAYLDARFDLAIEQFDADEEEGDDEEEEGDEKDSKKPAFLKKKMKVKTDDDDGEREPGDPGNEMSLEEANEDHKDSATAQEAMHVRHRNAWRASIAPGATAAE